MLSYFYGSYAPYFLVTILNTLPEVLLKCFLIENEHLHNKHKSIPHLIPRVLWVPEIKKVIAKGKK